MSILSKRFLKSSYLLVILLAAPLLYTACSSSTSDSAAEHRTSSEAGGKTIRFSSANDIGPLNPHMYAPNQMFAQNMVYESLVKYVDGKVVPHLAEKWEVSSDGKEYTFFLRKDVKFSDGSVFNADIVVKNIHAVLANKQRHSWLELVNQINDAAKVDDYTVKIILNNPYYPMLQELALIRPIRFLGEAGFPESGNTSEEIKAPIGTGPWVLTDYKINEYAEFSKNENYWGAKPKADKIRVAVIPDGESRVLAFENNELDVIYGDGSISLDSFKYLKESGKYETAISDPLFTKSIAMNSNKGPLKDINVRKAVEYAFNKKSVIDNVFYGTDRLADTLFPANFPYSNVKLTPYTYDVSKAEKLLNDAGWMLPAKKEFREKDGKALELELSFDSANNVHKAIAEVLQGDLRKIGINVKLIGEESQLFGQRQTNGNFDMIFSDTFGIPYDPHAMVSSMRVPSHADYQAQAGLPMKKELDQKIEEALLSTDENTRQQLYNYILTTLHEQAVYLPISYGTNLTVYHKNIKGLEFGQMNSEIPFEKMDKE
ncbi:Nickel-binding periplasmic protein precursor [Paenibacillus konkukensis]|uniref:Nickel-binding periplasmic protein n=1 Tax=Paenibacillus konkukensis TaxID=2020716 RepID=A0ABY4RHG8_9BACL|nr:nickel ABC transporter substrate-binding protein [Paenibacillus konkukensis]UQZ81079.1 Nickel-binding periplasmic protein precursor [Paenibacillus konkukensis]